MSVHSSQESAGSMRASPEQDSSTPSSVSQTLTGETCSGCDSPECRCTRTFGLSENQRGELLLTDVAHQLTSGGGKPGQGYPAVLIFSPAAFPAKTSPSQESEQDSLATDPASSSSSPESLSLFAPASSSSRTYQVSSLAKAVGTSEQCLERWPTSGMAWRGGLSTAVTSECRSDAGGCSSSEPTLQTILEEAQNVPAKYSLSARAARGILRRAEKRGRTLPDHLRAALAAVAGE